MANPRNLIVDAYNSLSADINKIGGTMQRENMEGVVSARLPELSVEMENAEILKLFKKFEKTWKESDVYGEWVKRSNENLNYWKGKHFQRPETDKTRALVDNVIFESVETIIPQFIARNPEGDVELRRDELDAQGKPTNPIATVYVDAMQSELSDLGDDLKLRSKFKKTARFWLINLVGVSKLGWDEQRKMPTMKAVRPQKIILDPDATVDEDGYTGEFVGEYRKLPAHKILKFVTEDGAKQAIKDLVKDELSTKVQFIEWWSDTTLVWTLGSDHVLMKRKNPHWNYDETVEDDLSNDFTPVGIAPEGENMPQMPEIGEKPSPEAPGRPSMPTLDRDTADLSGGMPEGSATEEDGSETEHSPDEPEGQPGDGTEEAMPAALPKGLNHLPAPRKPYLFMVMFNMGDQPVDNTSLITQNLANQDMINKRMKQIDKNADNMNGGLIVSLEKSGLTSSEARGVSDAVRKGGVVGIPTGNPQDAVWKPPTPGLPADIYNNLIDLRGRVKGLFGVTAITPQKLTPGQSVRGMVMNKTMDTDRIGGGISEMIEQHADDAYNWFVHLKLVYEPKYRALAESPQAQGQGLPILRVSVKEGSLLPEDRVTLANQAIALAGEGKMSTLDLYEALKYPNAKELAVNAWLETNAPDLLYDDPRVQQATQRAAQAAAAELNAKHGGKDAEKGPSTSISFKDLPPAGKAQLAAKAGINLHPEGIAAHEQAEQPGDETPPVPGMSPDNV